ncbi:hypothetical protein ACN47E_009588 [Coniothyrium glycines]
MASATARCEKVLDAEHWAKTLQLQLDLISAYCTTEDIPPTIEIDEIIVDAPRRRSADRTDVILATRIAHIMFPAAEKNSLAAIIQYEKQLSRLRKAVTIQRKRAIENGTKRNTEMNWELRIMKQGAWNPDLDPVSFDGAPSLPMPVEIASPKSLAPFFQHLSEGGGAQSRSSSHIKEALSIQEPWYGTHALEFERGVVYSDNRMDLCKMVLGPDNIGALMDSLRSNEFVTHFLLGNNIIGPHGAKCIADFLMDFPNRMDTWYLAGNCINAASFTVLVDQLVKSTSVTNIWLKRNPLGPSVARDVSRLITETANLRTLDLDQTELGDAGIAELFTHLANHNKSVSLRHIYLNAVGIGRDGATAIANYLRSQHCRLDSLYASNNPLGNEGLLSLATGLKRNRTLARLTLASVGASDEGIIAICEALEKHATLTTLDIGQNFATDDLGMRYNWLTDRSAFAVNNLIVISPCLAYLDVSYCAMTHLGLNTILAAVLESTTLLFYGAKTIWPQSRVASAVQAGQLHSKLTEAAKARKLENVQRLYGPDKTYEQFIAEEKRWLVSDKTDVRKIDSVYRNRDAGLARRGLKKLDKWWDVHDETLDRVKNAVGPVCTMRNRNAQVGNSCNEVSSPLIHEKAAVF